VAGLNTGTGTWGSTSLESSSKELLQLHRSMAAKEPTTRSWR
jgi:hypothetical protein